MVKAPHVDSHARLILPRLISNQSPIKLPVKTKPEPPERPKEPPSLKFLKKVQENVPPSGENHVLENMKNCTVSNLYLA